MSVLLIASSEPRAGRSTVAAGIAQLMYDTSASVTLARLAGDDAAENDAALFASIGSLPAPATPLKVDDARRVSGDLVLEAPPGDVTDIARALNARVIVVAAPQSPAFDVPSEVLAGTIVTRVQARRIEEVRSRAGVLAAIAEDAVLAAPAVGDIAAALGADSLHQPDEPRSINRMMLGTVASDAASPYFANRERIGVITRYDKTDIQLAALLADVVCIVITGGGEPSPYLLDRVRGRREEVALLSTARSTVEAMAAIESLYGASRFAGEGKLTRIAALLVEAGFTPPVPVSGAA